MPPLLTQVARISDGLPLVATVTANPGVPVSKQEQQEAKDILRSLTHQYVAFARTWYPLSRMVDRTNPVSFL